MLSHSAESCEVLVVQSISSRPDRLSSRVSLALQMKSAKAAGKGGPGNRSAVSRPLQCNAARDLNRVCVEVRRVSTRRDQTAGAAVNQP